jgi:hypothetical protein
MRAKIMSKIEFEILDHGCDGEKDGEELNPEWHHYVSIRWRIVA